MRRLTVLILIGIGAWTCTLAQDTNTYVVFFDNEIRASFSQMDIGQPGHRVVFQSGNLNFASNRFTSLPPLSIDAAQVLLADRVNEWWRGSCENPVVQRMVEVFRVDDRFQPLEHWILEDSRLGPWEADVFDGKIDNPWTVSLTLWFKNLRKIVI